LQFHGANDADHWKRIHDERHDRDDEAEFDERHLESLSGPRMGLSRFPASLEDVYEHKDDDDQGE
jgi:hypothetical protein